MAPGEGRGHNEHAHHNAACSGAFYTKVPRNDAVDPITFSDPRGAWGLTPFGDPYKPTLREQGWVPPNVEESGAIVSTQATPPATPPQHDYMQRPLGDCSWSQQSGAQPAAPFHHEYSFFPRAGQMVVFPVRIQSLSHWPPVFDTVNLCITHTLLAGTGRAGWFTGWSRSSAEAAARRRRLPGGRESLGRSTSSGARCWMPGPGPRCERYIYIKQDCYYPRSAQRLARAAGRPNRSSK